MILKHIKIQSTLQEKLDGMHARAPFLNSQQAVPCATPNKHLLGATESMSL